MQVTVDLKLKNNAFVLKTIGKLLLIISPIQENVLVFLKLSEVDILNAIRKIIDSIDNIDR